MPNAAPVQPPPDDDELIRLLGGITKKKPKEVVAAPPPTPAPKIAPVTAPPPPVVTPQVQPVIEDLEDEIEEPPKPIIKPAIVEPELEDPPEVIPLRPIQPADLVQVKKDQPQDSIGVRTLLKQFGNSVEKILVDVEKDREQIESAITYFETTVRGTTDRKGISPYVDGWARLLQTKGEINVSRASVLDSIAKLVAAGKSNDLIINLGEVKKGSLDLEQLLTQPLKDDEKK